MSDGELGAAMRTLTGDIEQVPSSVSAIKVDGVRSYQRVRDGEAVELKPPAGAPSPSSTSRSSAAATTSTSTSPARPGTYVRALARDLGRALGVGGHLTALRRTRVGGFTLDAARTLEQLEQELTVVPLAAAVDAAFPGRCQR